MRFMTMKISDLHIRAYRLCIIVMYIQTVGLVLRLKMGKKSKLFCIFILLIFITHILRKGEYWKRESFSITFINMVVAVLFKNIFVS